jgi:orotate phosphoribosyltransferase
MSDLTKEILDSIRRVTALQLWQLGAVKVDLANPFKLTSGNYSPIYINCRHLISSPAFCDLFSAAARILCEADRVEFDVVAGGETAGIPFAAFLARGFGKPMVYVRKQAKSHGTESQIEGVLRPARRVLLVEDLITDAGSKQAFIAAIRRVGAVVEDAVVVFDRLQGGREALQKDGVRLHALSDMNIALSVGEEAGAVSSEATSVVRLYLKDPREWHKSMRLRFTG